MPETSEYLELRDTWNFSTWNCGIPGTLGYLELRHTRNSEYGNVCYVGKCGMPETWHQWTAADPTISLFRLEPEQTQFLSQFF
jgi:hypothetical protein